MMKIFDDVDDGCDGTKRFPYLSLHLDNLVEVFLHVSLHNVHNEVVVEDF